MKRMIYKNTERFSRLLLLGLFFSAPLCFMYTGCEITAARDTDEIDEDKEIVNVDKGCHADPAMPVNLCDEMGDGWIFCDDFESDDPLSDRYFEYTDRNLSFVVGDSAGRGGGRGMKAAFQQGQADNGSLKLSFGRHEDEYAGNKAVMPEENFSEIYWRFDLCHESGWTGGGGHKLSRSTTLLEGWKQGHIAHIWDGGPQRNYLRMDPDMGWRTSAELPQDGSCKWY